MGGAVVDGCCCWAAGCAAAPFLFSLPSPALEVSRPIVHLLGFRASPKIPTSDVFFKQGCNFTFKRVTFSFTIVILISTWSVLASKWSVLASKWSVLASNR